MFYLTELAKRVGLSVGGTCRAIKRLGIQPTERRGKRKLYSEAVLAQIDGIVRHYKTCPTCGNRIIVKK